MELGSRNPSHSRNGESPARVLPTRRHRHPQAPNRIAVTGKQHAILLIFSCSFTFSAPLHSRVTGSRPQTPNTNRSAMAPADAGDFLLDEEDDDFFGEFNPHPYQGGYDLAATFGTPLPPSSKICYPLSSSAAADVPAIPAIPSPSLPTPEPKDVFPNVAAREGKVRRGRRGFWKKCVRVLDYLFCYQDPYEERRIVVDSYVVPIYANRKEIEEDAFSVKVEVAPPSVGIVEEDDATGELVQTNDLSWHSNNRDEADTYSQLMSNSYYTPSFAQSYGLHGVLGKPDWFLNFSYSESNQVEEFHHETALSYDIDCKISDQPIHCYHYHCYVQSLGVQVEPTEPVSSERLEYYEHFSTYRDQSDIHILETPAHAYNIQSYTRTSDLALEPFKPSCSEVWGFYDAYTQGNALENNKNSFPPFILERQNRLSRALVMSMHPFSKIGII